METNGLAGGMAQLDQLQKSSTKPSRSTFSGKKLSKKDPMSQIAAKRRQT